MKRPIIGFILPSPWYKNQSSYSFNGEFNGYVAVPNERVCEEWIGCDDDGWQNNPDGVCSEITLNQGGEWAMNRKLYNNVVGNIDDIDESYRIFGWDYAHIFNTPENSSFECVVNDVKNKLNISKKNHYETVSRAAYG